MTLYLLDTNALSALIHEPAGTVAQRLGAVGVDQVCTSVIVAAELRYGAAKRGSLRLSERVGDSLNLIEVRPFERPADEIYGRLRADLEARGLVISGHDMLIAAHALSLDLIVVTDNEGEFRRVPALQVENWLRPA